MKDFDLNHIIIFHELVKNRSISDTASALNLSAAKISRDIKLLESSLSTVLFLRKKNGLSLTPAGEYLFEETATILDVNKNVRGYFLGNDYGKKRRLDLNLITTKGYSGYYATKLVREFLAKNVDISLNLFTTDADINESHFFGDISISNQKLLSEEFDHFLLNDNCKVAFVASRGYVTKNGAPKTFTDLKQHDLIAYNFSLHGNRKSVDRYIRELNVKAKFRVNNLFAILDLVRDDLGIGYLPRVFAKEHIKDPVIFDDFPSESFPQFVTFKKGTLHKPQVKRFLDFLSTKK